jgi:hypothetical protein
VQDRGQSVVFQTFAVGRTWKSVVGISSRGVIVVRVQGHPRVDLISHQWNVPDLYLTLLTDRRKAAAIEQGATVVQRMIRQQCYSRTAVVVGFRHQHDQPWWRSGLLTFSTQVHRDLPPALTVLYRTLALFLRRRPIKGEPGAEESSFLAVWWRQDEAGAVDNLFIQSEQHEP